MNESASHRPVPGPLAPQPVVPPSLDGVGLHDCDAEPIHTPGHVQPHGVLMAFDTEGRLRNWSTNASQRLGLSLHLQMTWQHLPWPETLRDALGTVRDELRAEGLAPPRLLDLQHDVNHDEGFDLVIHGHAGRVIVEFERRVDEDPLGATFLSQAHRVVDRLQRQRELLPLLKVVTDEVRAMTGFDRVMLYRFLHDDSGEVMAESRRSDLEPLLGMRYPASDIPAQARRLYVLSTLRLIADVADAPVAVLGQAGDAPLDMSHAVLRSVSPIHIEYLRNMGVQASMSISIVLDGRLWGLIACHHYAPHRPAYGVRTACDVVAQVLAARISGLESAARAALATQAAQSRARLAHALQSHDDVLAAHVPLLPDLMQMFEGAAVIVTHGGQQVVHGAIDESHVRAVLASVPADGNWIQRQSRGDWPAAVQTEIGPWVGLLGVGFDPASNGWVLALRPEQEQLVRWGGQPEKVYREGPRGPRLSPRGSFAEWRETVRDQAIPWAEAERTAAHHLQADLQRETLVRHAEVERARTQMLAILGHDLRDPLNTIRMAAGALERARSDELQQRIGQRIKSSSGRMERLVTHLLDLSRIRSGRGLDVRAEPGDLVALLQDLVDEARTAHPGSEVHVQAPEVLQARFDADRLAQAVGNLLSNARHHGQTLSAVVVRLFADVRQGGAVIEVRNPAPPLPAEVSEQLFQAFKPSSDGGAGRHRGLGLGLYIAHHIVSEHGGRLVYAHEHPDVVFRIHLPSG